LVLILMMLLGDAGAADAGQGNSKVVMLQVAAIR
jgi:hypothetical protein